MNIYQNNLTQFRENPLPASRLHDEITIDFQKANETERTVTERINIALAIPFFISVGVFFLTNSLPVLGLLSITLLTGIVQALVTLFSNRRSEELSHIESITYQILGNTTELNELLDNFPNAPDLSEFTRLNENPKNLYAPILAKYKYWANESLVCKTQIDQGNITTSIKMKLVNAKINQAFAIYVLMNPIKRPNEQGLLINKNIEDFRNLSFFSNSVDFIKKDGTVLNFEFFKDNTVNTVAQEIFGITA